MADNARLTRITGLPRPFKFKSIEDATKAQEELYRALSEWRVDIPRPNQLSTGLYVRPEWYGAVGDGVTDDTAAINSAITAAGDSGTIAFSSKKYLTSGFTITKPITIVGMGWGSSGTVIQNTGANPTITISAESGYTGATISNLCIKGNSDTNGASTSGDGMLINAQGQTLLHRVYLYNHGGYGLKIEGTSYGIILDDCRVEYNVLDGIYGRTEGSAQINGISIRNSEITNNAISGINLWANAVVVVGNIIEGNTGAGILFSGSDMVTTNASMQSAWVHDNYFEANAGGHIVVVTEYAGGGATIHACQKLHIDNNYLYLTDAQASPGVTAIIDISGYYGGVAGLVIGRSNNFGASDLYWVDLNNIGRADDVVEINQMNALHVHDTYINLGDARVLDPSYTESADPPSAAPEYVGEKWLDTTANRWYVATGTSSVANWVMTGMMPQPLTLTETFAYGQSYDDMFILQPSLAGGTATNPTSVGSILWNPEGIPIGRINCVMDNPSADYESNITLWTATTGGTLAEKMRITHEGNSIISGVYRCSTSNYRRYYHVPLGAANPGASGATWVDGGANTTGGWQLNAAGETIRGGTDIHSDWDGASDMKVEVRFNVNVDNTGGAAGDTVDLKLVCYYKGVGDTATKTQTVEVPTTVGASAQYKEFKADFTLNWDETSNVIEAGDHISFYLNLETDTSEVDDVIITGMSFSYLTTHIGIEDGDE